MPDKYRVAKLADIPSPTATAPEWYEWKPIRHHLGIGAFGVNAGIAHNAGDWVVEEHTELQENAAGHEELYFVVQGHARFTIDGEEIDAPAGTLVFVADPGTRRAAKASVPETTVLYVGARRGEAFQISRWERKYWDD
jgi:quercetin dioxygenase-like cupin family protein